MLCISYRQRKRNLLTCRRKANSKTASRKLWNPSSFRSREDTRSSKETDFSEDLIKSTPKLLSTERDHGLEGIWSTKVETKVGMSWRQTAWMFDLSVNERPAWVYLEGQFARLRGKLKIQLCIWFFWQSKIFIVPREVFFLSLRGKRELISPSISRTSCKRAISGKQPRKWIQETGGYKLSRYIFVICTGCT